MKLLISNTILHKKPESKEDYRKLFTRLFVKNNNYCEIPQSAYNAYILFKAGLTFRLNPSDDSKTINYIVLDFDRLSKKQILIILDKFKDIQTKGLSPTTSKLLDEDILLSLDNKDEYSKILNSNLNNYKYKVFVPTSNIETKEEYYSEMFKAIKELNENITEEIFEEYKKVFPRKDKEHIKNKLLETYILPDISYANNILQLTFGRISKDKLSISNKFDTDRTVIDTDKMKKYLVSNGINESCISMSKPLKIADYINKFKCEWARNNIEKYIDKNRYLNEFNYFNDIDTENKILNIFDEMKYSLKDRNYCSDIPVSDSQLYNKFRITNKLFLDNYPDEYSWLNKNNKLENPEIFKIARSYAYNVIVCKKAGLYSEYNNSDLEEMIIKATISKWYYCKKFEIEKDKLAELQIMKDKAYVAEKISKAILLFRNMLLDDNILNDYQNMIICKRKIPKDTFSKDKTAVIETIKNEIIIKAKENDYFMPKYMKQKFIDYCLANLKLNFTDNEFIDITGKFRFDNKLTDNKLYDKYLIKWKKEFISKLNDKYGIDGKTIHRCKHDICKNMTIDEFNKYCKDNKLDKSIKSRLKKKYFKV